MYRLLLLSAASVLSACAPAELDPPGAPDSAPAGATPVAAGAAAAVQAPASHAAERVTIAGCCSFSAPAGATVSTPGGMPIDGFRQYSIALGGEKVHVEPLLGAHGWLGAAGGTAIRLDGRPARETRTAAGGMAAVLPLRAQLAGRETLMSLQVRSDCGGGSTCSLYRAILASMNVEARWTAQPAT
jgi:hypothetical protein